MTKVNVFVYGRQRLQQQRRHCRHQGYDNSPPDFRHGKLKRNNSCLGRLKIPEMHALKVSSDLSEEQALV